MTDHALHGNHDRCLACALQREARGPVPIRYGEIACNVCGGKGYIPLSDEEIVRRTAEEACRIYWPAFNARLQAAGCAPEARNVFPAPDTKKSGAAISGRSGEELQLELPLLQTDLADVSLQA